MLKQLREDGFSVTGFERRGRVGGLWAYSEDTSHTTALPSKRPRPHFDRIKKVPNLTFCLLETMALLSKYTCGFSDYPMPESK